MNTLNKVQTTITSAQHNGIIDESTAKTYYNTARLIDSIIAGGNVGTVYNLANNYRLDVLQASDAGETLDTLRQASANKTLQSARK